MNTAFGVAAHECHAEWTRGLAVHVMDVNVIAASGADQCNIGVRLAAVRQAYARHPNEGMTIACHRVPHEVARITTQAGFMMEENAAMSAVHELPGMYIVTEPLKGEASKATDMHERAVDCIGVVEEAHGEGSTVARTVPAQKIMIIHDAAPSPTNSGCACKGLGT